MIGVRVLTHIRTRYQPKYPYPLSAGVSLSVISRSFLAVVPVLPGNAEVLDEILKAMTLVAPIRYYWENGILHILPRKR